MGYYFGKGTTAPTDELSASPTVPGAPNNQAECTQKCNDRYQKDLDNPSVDYAQAQQRYNDCKMSCQDIPAIQEQAGSIYGRTATKLPEDGEDGGGGGAGGGGGGGGGCAGGKLLHDGEPQAGDEYKCGAGFTVKSVKVAGAYLANRFETWCCPVEGYTGKEPWGGTDCAKKCSDELNANLEKGMDYPAALELWKKCYAACPGGKSELCVGGYESNAKVDGVYPDCKEGMVERTMPNGTRWCCPGGDLPEDCVAFIEGQPCEDGYEMKMYNGVRYCCPEGDPTGDDACEGGHILDNRYTGGKGKGLRPLTAEERDPYIPEDAGWMRSADWQGHQIWNAEFGFQDLKAIHNYYKGGATDASGLMGKGTRPIDFACEKGMTRKTIDGEQWCCPSGDGGGGDGVGLGEYQWPAELQELYDLLMGRGKEFMGKETGYTDEAIRAMFGRDFENIRDVGARTAETGLSALQREGLMGTGASQDLASDAAWNTEQGISNTMRDLLVADEEKKKQDLLDHTGAAQSIFGGGIGYNSMLEQMNAGRRGEGRDSMAMLLQYLMSLMSSWGA